MYYLQEQKVEIQQQPESEVTIGGDGVGESEADENVQAVEVTVSQGEQLGVTPEVKHVIVETVSVQTRPLFSCATCVLFLCIS